MTQTRELPSQDPHTFVIDIPAALTQQNFLKVFSLNPLQPRAEPLRLRYADIEVLSKRLEVPTLVLLKLLNVSESTYHTKKREHRELAEETTRDLLRLARVTHFTEEFYGDELAKAHLWLTRPRASLGSPEHPRSPLEFALLPGGEAYITNYLGQMQYGISP